MTAVKHSIGFTPSDPLLLIYTASGDSLLCYAASDKTKLYLQKFLSCFVSSETSLSSNQTFRFVHNQCFNFVYSVAFRAFRVSKKETPLLLETNKTNGFKTDKLSFLISYEHGFFNSFKYQNLEDSPSSLQVLRTS